MLYNRDPQARVEKVAPWLTVDGDPYPAVIDGRIQWILDGYTTTDRYPNSQRESFESMIEDALQVDTGLQTVPTDEINYMRSAVKATVDAYDGTVTLYAWDEEDPILRTWMSAFPGTVEKKADIPASLLEHLRYPEDLFKVQRFQLARYHVTDASAFYQGSERWEVPTDPELPGSKQPPYRFFAGSGATDPGQWSLTSVFVPRGKGNLASYVSVDSDATSDAFGAIKLLKVDDANAPGPGQVANEMQQDEGVTQQLTQFRVAGATPPVFGNLLTVPVNDGLIYVQPVYAVRPGAASSFPILQFVIVRYGSKIGIDRDIPLALADALGVEIDQNPDGNGDGNGNGNGTATATATATRLPNRRSLDCCRRRATCSTRPPKRSAPTTPRSGPACSNKPSRRWRTHSPSPVRRESDATPDDQATDDALGRQATPPGSDAHRFGAVSPHALTLGLTDAGWSSSVARWAHNPEVAGSNPAPATKRNTRSEAVFGEIREPPLIVFSGACGQLVGRPRRRRALACRPDSSGRVPGSAPARPVF